MAQIPFIDLEAQQRRIRKQLESRILNVLDHGEYIMGREVTELEEKLCAFCGAKFCVSCSSGSDAILMTLMAWNTGAGDAVFVPAFTFFATAEMPAILSATPVFVDIDPVYFMMDPRALEAAILHILRTTSLSPKAVLPVDLFGQPADYTQILPVAQKFGIPVLEDAAQAFGASANGKHTCALGAQAAGTSFFPAKPLGCYGDGGAIFTNEPALAGILRSIRTHGQGSDKYNNSRIGLNGRLDTMQAAVLLAKLDIFNEEIKQRQKVAENYASALDGIPGLVVPTVKAGSKSVWAQYCVLVPPNERTLVMQNLKNAGIPSHIYYPRPLPLLEAFASLGHGANEFPVAMDISRRILALPFHPWLEEETIYKIAAVIRKTLA